jgi:hypothetical protein
METGFMPHLVGKDTGRQAGNQLLNLELMTRFEDRIVDQKVLTEEIGFPSHVGKESADYRWEVKVSHLLCIEGSDVGAQGET